MKTLKNSKIFLIAVLFSVGLVGCEARLVRPIDLEKGETLCKNNGGLKHAWVEFSDVQYICNDGLMTGKLKRKAD